MQTLKICDLGLAPDTSHAFHSMLQIVAGRSKARWQLAGVAEADVLFASPAGRDDVLAAWGRSGKPVVLVTDDRSGWSPATFVLRHPFRVMQLLAVLDDVADLLADARPREPGSASGWAGAQSLRALVPQANALGWHVARTTLGEEIWLGRGQVLADAATIARLRGNAFELTAFHPAGSAPPATGIALAVSDFAWQVGMATPGTLAPWLDPATAYRLRRWPDFGRLGVSTGLLELCAASTVRAWTPAALADASGQSAANAHRFLAAASLAGLLAANGHEPAHAPIARGRLQGGWDRFLGGLRRHLGLAA
ncbi:MAG TPA: hypothetical protein VFS55_15425 [Dokdonella sp.]|nr:hypothetical protein [Dokdonella sp.]